MRFHLLVIATALVAGRARAARPRPGRGTTSPRAAATAKSWAAPQIASVVLAGIMGPDVASFRPDDALTRGELHDAIVALGKPHTAPLDPLRLVTMRELDAQLVAAAGLLPSARAIRLAARDGGLEPTDMLGTETIARLLGLRVNHPIGSESLERAPNEPASRAEAAYSLAKLRLVDTFRIAADPRHGGRRSSCRSSGPGSGRSLVARPALRRLPLRLLRDVGEGAEALERDRAGRHDHRPGRLRLLGPRVAGLQDPAVRRRAAARRRAQGAHDVRHERRGRHERSASRRRRSTRRRAVLRRSRAEVEAVSEVGHSGIYVGNGWFVHSSSAGVTLQPLQGWYATTARVGTAPAGRSGPVRLGVRIGGVGSPPCAGRGFRARATWRTAAARVAAVSVGAGSRSRWERAPAGSESSSRSSPRSSSAATSSAAAGDSGFSPGGGLEPAPAGGAGRRAGNGRGHGLRVHEVRQPGRAGSLDDDLPGTPTGQYPRAPVVTFTAAEPRRGCGPASSATGPFYCPADNKVYLDLSFFQELVAAIRRARRLRRALRDRARDRAPRADGARDRGATCAGSSRTIPGTPTSTSSAWSSRPTASPASGRTRRTSGAMLEEGDIEEGLGAAAAVGDDRLGAQQPGAVDARLVGAPRGVVPQAASSPATRTTATPATSRSEPRGVPVAASRRRRPIRIGLRRADRRAPPTISPAIPSRNTAFEEDGAMTELAEAPAVERDGAITRIPHWIGGARVEGTSGRSGPGLQPGRRCSERRGRPRVGRGGRRRGPERDRGVPGLARDLDREARGAVLRRSASCSTRSARTSRSSSRPSTARCSRTRWARSRAGSR